MQLLISDPTYESDGVGYDQFLSDLKSEVAQLSETSDYEETDIGRGADWPMVMVILTGLFFLGERIKKNLDAWINLVQRFDKFLRRMAEKSWGYRVDEHGAMLIALNLIYQYQQGDIRSIEKLSLQRIDYEVWADRNRDNLDHHPSALYMMSFRINDERLYILGVKSSGQIAYQYLSTLLWHEFDNEIVDWDDDDPSKKKFG